MSEQLVKVGFARWVVPAAVQAVEPTTAGKVRLHLSGGGVMDIPIPSADGVGAFTEGLLRKMLTPSESA